MALLSNFTGKNIVSKALPALKNALVDSMFPVAGIARSGKQVVNALRPQQTQAATTTESTVALNKAVPKEVKATPPARTTALSGTPTSAPAQAAPMAPQAPVLTAEQQKEADARKYLEEENRLSQEMGSKNFVSALRGTNGRQDTVMRYNTDGTPVNAGSKSTLEIKYGPDGKPLTGYGGERKLAYGTGDTQRSNVTELGSRVSSLSAPSADEVALTDELAKFRGDAAMGISNIEGQGRGIPLSLVRGQQAKLGEQAAIQEQTLLDRIAAASAQRQAQLAAATQEYTMAANEQARQDQLAQYEQKRQDSLTAPTTIGNSILQFDPATGTYKTLYTAPAEATQSDMPTSVQEYQFAVQNGYTGGYTDFLTAKAAAGQSPSNLQFVSPSATFGGGVFDPNTGTFTPNASATQTQSSQLSKDALNLISTLVNHPGLAGATGTVRLALPGSQAADFKAQLERLKSLLSLENISYLKGTGAMSDREFATLSSAAAALDPKMSESAFRNELQRIQAELNTEINGGQSAVTSDPRYQQLKNSGFSDEEISEYLGFPDDLSTSVNGSKATGVQAAQALTTNYKPGSYGGQCGRFVNRLTGFQMGNTYASKMSYVNPSIGKTEPVQPGDVFVMPYKQYGHTGFVAEGAWVPKSDGTYDIPVVDSNWNNTTSPEKVSHHYINSSKISGFARAPITTSRVSFS